MNQDVFMALRRDLGDALLAKVVAAIGHFRARVRQRTASCATVDCSRLEWVQRVTRSLAGGYNAMGTVGVEGRTGAPELQNSGAGQPSLVWAGNDPKRNSAPENSTRRRTRSTSS